MVHYASLVVILCVLCLVAEPTRGGLLSPRPPKVARVQTVAGSPIDTATPGFLDGNGTTARFFRPTGLAVDPKTGKVYISDSSNCAIREVDLSFSVVTVAGSPPSLGRNCSFLDASVGTNARFMSPIGLVILHDVVYVADATNDRIRAVALNDGGTYAVTTVAGQSVRGTANGIGTNAQFYVPADIAYHEASESLLVTEYYGYQVRSVTLSTKAVTTVAGLSVTPGFTDGVGSNARFNRPYGIGVESTSGLAIVADQLNCALRLVDVNSRLVKTLAGHFPSTSTGFVDGNGTEALFNNTLGVTYDRNTNGMVTVDSDNCAVRWVSLAGNVTTIAGNPPPTPLCGHVDGEASAARFRAPYFSAVHPTRDGLYIVSDTGNHAVRFVYLADSPRPSSASSGASYTDSVTLSLTYSGSTESRTAGVNNLDCSGHYDSFSIPVL